MEWIEIVMEGLKDVVSRDMIEVGLEKFKAAIVEGCKVVIVEGT